MLLCGARRKLPRLHPMTGRMLCVSLYHCVPLDPQYHLCWMNHTVRPVPRARAHILAHRILKIEGNIWYEVGLRRGNFWNWSLEMKENLGIRPLAVASQWMVAVISLWPLDGHCYVLMGSGCLLRVAGGLWMLAESCWWALDAC